MMVIHGAAIGLNTLEGLRFNPHEPFTYCGICGAVYQTDMDRNPRKYLSDSFGNDILNVRKYAEGKRRQWSHSHAKLHSDLQHRSLRLSGRHVTPDAANKLAAYGVIPLKDAATDEEVNAALLESNPVPLNDSEE